MSAGLGSLSCESFTEREIARFWSRVDTSGGADVCWPWTGHCNEEGYGRFDARNTGYFSHRIAYELTSKDPLGERLACHTCDNEPCCNPAHIFPGTHLDNNRDRHRKGRSAPITKVTLEQRSRGDDHYSRKRPEALARGEHHVQAKLTEKSVVAIRKERARGVILADLAAKYRVSIAVIHKVCARTSWTHVK
jgi:hypothetical protein